MAIPLIVLQKETFSMRGKSIILYDSMYALDKLPVAFRLLFLIWIILFGKAGILAPLHHVACLAKQIGKQLVKVDFAVSWPHAKPFVVNALVIPHCGNPPGNYIIFHFAGLVYHSDL